MPFTQSRPFSLVVGSGIRLTATASGLVPTLRLFDPEDALIEEVVGSGDPSVAAIFYIATVSGLYRAEVESDTAGSLQLEMVCDDCTPTTHVSLNETVTYSTVCGLTPGPFTFVSENDVNALEVVSLYDHFPLEENADGDCPLGWSRTRSAREHSAGDLVMGPYAEDVIIIAATDIYADDQLTINGSEVVIIGDRVCKGTVLYELAAGNTATVECWELGGAWCFAVGYLAASPAACVPETDCSDGPPEGWCDLGESQSMVNLVPDMTGFTTPSGVVSSSTPESGGEAWKAFDRNVATGFSVSDTDPSPWIQYEFESAQRVEAYYISLQNSGPVDMHLTVEASTDGASWITQDEQDNVSGGDLVGSFTLAAPAVFKFWRFSVAVSGGAASLFIPDLELLGPRTLCDCNQLVEAGCIHCNTGLPEGGTTVKSCTDWLAGFTGGCIPAEVWAACGGCLGGDWVVVPHNCPFDDPDPGPPYCSCENEVYLIPPPV